MTSDNLFNKLVPFFVRTDASAASDKRKQNLLVRVALSLPKNGRMKVLEVELTDEADLFFLYQIQIGEDDFQTLRHEQNLLVDFLQFPSKFLELLELCREHGYEDNPKFLAQLSSYSNADTVLFSIVETNSFKHITHISMKLIRGNDSSVKVHLADLIKQHKKNENSSLKLRLDETTKSLSAQLQDVSHTSSGLSTELEKLKISHAEQASRLELKYSKMIAAEKDQSVAEREALKRKHDEEKFGLQRSYEDKIVRLNEKLESLLASNSRLKSETEAQQYQSENDKKIMNAYADDLRTKNQELELMRQSNRDLESRLEDLERNHKGATDSNTGLQATLRERTDTISRQQTQISNLEEVKAKAEQALTYCQSRISTLEANIETASEEISKGNEIIRRLQTDLKGAKSKIKLKNVVTLQQEKLLDERSSMISVQQEELATLKDTNTKLTKDGADLKAKVEDLERKVEEGKQIIAENTQVIEWLHKQLNEEGLAKPGLRFNETGFDLKNSLSATNPILKNRHSKVLDLPFREINRQPPTIYDITRYKDDMNNRDHGHFIDQNSFIKRDTPSANDKSRIDSQRLRMEKSNYFP
ncbi:Spindle assembly abnormal protein 6 [Dinochytrium kinnereticum]|nr:Spindle assembly abnormal protein 6 [Dinochytrium kinnereticum]